MHRANFILLRGNHEFYRVIPNTCEGSYKISAIYQISPLRSK